MGVVMKQYHISHWATPDDSIPLHVRALECQLPHGSGLNGDWHFDVTQRTVHAYNTFSAMDEGGGYCHDYPVEVIIPIRKGFQKPDELKVVVHERQHSCCGYGLREYLDDTIYESLQAED